MTTFTLGENLVARFQQDGFLLVEDLFDQEEMDLLRHIARADQQLVRQAASRRDGQGGVVKLSLRNELSEDIYSAIVRCRRVVEVMERLLGGEV